MFVDDGTAVVECGVRSVRPDKLRRENGVECFIVTLVETQTACASTNGS